MAFPGMLAVVRGRRAWVTVAFAAGMAGLGCSGSSEETPTFDEALVDKGRDVYRNCVVCHGSTGDGEGTVGPPIGDGAAAEAFPDVEDEIRFLLRGAPAKMQPAFEGHLTRAELEAVIYYERNVLGTPADDDPLEVRTTELEPRDPFTGERR